MENVRNEQLKSSFIFTFFFCVFAHGYRFMNFMNTHDSMVSIVQDDVYWQRSLGRFMQPLVLVARGVICAPWLIGMISMLFLGFSVWLAAQILDIENRGILFLISGIMVCNITLTTSCAVYQPWTDIYAVTLLLNLLGVWCCTKKTWKWLCAASACFAFGMGFYQAYITVAIALLLIIGVRQLIDENDFKVIAKTVVGYVLSLLGGTLLYYLLYKGVCTIHHVQIANSYNGISSIGDYGSSSILTYIVGAYKEFFSQMNHANSFVSIILLNVRVKTVWEIGIVLVNWYCVAVVVIGIIRLCVRKKKKWWNCILCGICILSFPLAINFVYVLSKGMVHVLMEYSFVTIHLFAVKILLMNTDAVKQNERTEKSNVMRILRFLPLLIVIWNNIVLSNQVYYKLQMQQEALQSVMTKITYEIENLDGYEYGVTPVVFGGTFVNNPFIMVPEYFTDVSVLGMTNTPVNNTSAIRSYVRSVLNNPMQIIEGNPGDEPFSEMPSFPSKGSVLFLDDKAFVKISE